MDTDNHQWSTATDLPQPLCHTSVKICGDRLFIIGGVNEDFVPSKSVYAYALDALFQSVNFQAPLLVEGINKTTASATIESNDQQYSISLQNKVTDLPVTQTTCIMIAEHSLLAIGGKDSENKFTTAIHMYKPSTDSWEVISHMATPRSRCFATFLHDNQLMIVGGRTLVGDSDTTELITLF